MRVLCFVRLLFFFFFNDTATTEIYTLSLHDALPISQRPLDGLPLRIEDALLWPNENARLHALRVAASSPYPAAAIASPSPWRSHSSAHRGSSPASTSS